MFTAGPQTLNKAILPFVRRITMREVTMRQEQDEGKETLRIQFQDYIRDQGKLEIVKEKGSGYVVKEASGRFRQHRQEIENHVSIFNQRGK